MSFLQPWMLIALPLMAIPLIVHLVNQRRFQTIPWAAMMFLLQASKMSSGYTKLRQWLILAMRTLAIASLIFFTSRPLASGLIGLLGNKSGEVAVVLIDRSPSMRQVLPGSGLTKLESAMLQLSSTIETLGVQRVVVFDTATEKPLEYETPSAMTSDPALVSNDVTCDMPGLLERALTYIKNNRFGNTNIWVCSDLRESDWKSRDGRWAASREGFLSLPQEVRFNLLDLGTVSKDNLSIRIVSAKRVQGTSSPELALSFRLERFVNGEGTASAPATPLQVPVEIEVAGARSVLNVDIQADSAEVNDFRIALSSDSKDANADKGWGVVRIPADANSADNTSYFVFEKPPTRNTVIVTDNPRVIEAIELCTNIAPDQSIQCATETVSSSQLDSVDWNQTSLLVWHEQLPKDKSLEILTQFVSQGGQILFFPPENPSDTQALGLQWIGWETLQAGPTADSNSAVDDDQSKVLSKVQQWRNDSELLGNTLNGAPLPVGQIGIKRICRVQGDGTVLAAIQDDVPLLLRIETADSNQSGIYVCTTTPSLRDSTLALDGVVMYIAIQRVLAAGSARIGTTKSASVGLLDPAMFEQSNQQSGDSNILSNQYAQHSGVYRNNDLLIAQNRSTDEDSGRTVSGENLTQLFGSLKWSRIEVGASAKSLVQEIWRWFVIAMLVSLVIEAALCIPKRKPATAVRR